MSGSTDRGPEVVVLAGGAARRLGGVDKPAVRIGGRPLLDRVLAACPAIPPPVVVGPPRPTARQVRWTREQPPGGGPLPALAAGLALTGRPLVAVLAADLPFLDPDTLPRLVAALPPEADGALLVDGEGRDQPLTAVYRAAPLRRALAALGPDPAALAGRPLRGLLGRLRLRRLAGPATLDCDTWPDIAAARARIGDHGEVLEEWITAVKAELGVELDVDTTALLNAARDAAHGVARPAAPLTTFLLGYAAGRTGLPPAEAAARISALAADWERRRAVPSQAPAAAPEEQP
ncbi:NTP transferase domain-containing protein [Streptomyces sp. DSM 44915]|uniref:NTP transferase domain-containing protein n=1 Tax=Streptomyces chisholmiae TaxID=3075540 RepID=A0ABU2JPN0_9ACTN|nr:NTP transferase domain-containing protein [Streptomyces sp. DSM 44915]MDT0266941.1 NTP transferase domain-containing protein [Streptomyces sp. DSM 44915]